MSGKPFDPQQWAIATGGTPATRKTAGRPVALHELGPMLTILVQALEQHQQLQGDTDEWAVEIHTPTRVYTVAVTVEPRKDGGS